MRRGGWVCRQGGGRSGVIRRVRRPLGCFNRGDRWWEKIGRGQATPKKKKILCGPVILSTTSRVSVGMKGLTEDLWQVLFFFSGQVGSSFFTGSVA